MGLIWGLLAPIFGFLLYYFWKFFPTYSLAEFFDYIFQNKSLITAISSFSLLANAIIFTLYINTHKDKTAKGIFIVTCVYALAMIVVKIIFK